MMSSTISGQSTGGHGNGNGTNVGGSSIVGVGSALSFMGCVREASPSPHNHHHHHHHHHHHTLAMEDFDVQQNHNTIVKEPKKRRFHPLRGLRRIFRRKSRSAADSRMDMSEHDSETIANNREELAMKHPAGRAEEIRSKSASELLTDSCDRQSIFLRRHGMDEPFSKLLNAPGQLSVSHDSIFPGEVPYTRPLSSLNALTTLERRQGNVSDESVENDYSRHGFYNHRISLEVLELMKTTAGQRHHVTKQTSAEISHGSQASRECYQQETENYFTRGDKHERRKVTSKEEKQVDIEQRLRTSHHDGIDKRAILPRADLPEFESRSLSHTAAHHRISVRPKNRRPPRRNTFVIPSRTSNVSTSTIEKIPESSDTLDSLEPITDNDNDNDETTPSEAKSVSVMRESAIQLSSNSEISDSGEKSGSGDSVSPDSLDLSVTAIMPDNCKEEHYRDMKCVIRESSDCISKISKDELETLKMKIPRKSSILNKYTKSPDTIVNSFSKSSEGFNQLIESPEVIPQIGGHSKYISKSTDGFEQLSDQLKVKPVSKRLASKSTEPFDNFGKALDSVTREKHNHLNQLFTINHTVPKFDGVQTADTLLNSDDTVIQRRSSIENPSRSNRQVMSMSSESFDALEKSEQFKKRSSVADIHLSSTPRHSRLINKSISKSTESIDTVATDSTKHKHINTSIIDKHYWKISHKETSSESMSNLDVEDDRENREIRIQSEKKRSSNTLDIMCENSNYKDGKRQSSPMKKPPLFQKSSESSELGSTDTLGSYKCNKLFASTDTINSFDRDLDNDGKNELYHKNNSKLIETSVGESDVYDSNHVNDENNSDSVGHTATLVPSDQYYWRQRSDSRENIDIHQLLAITIVSRMTDNGNNQRNSVTFPKMNLASSPTSSVVKQESNKLLLNDLIVNKNNEELQNMLNGNISEVSTDTKSFKEKLIMFEKLGK